MCDNSFQCEKLIRSVAANGCSETLDLNFFLKKIQVLFVCHPGQQHDSLMCLIFSRTPEDYSPDQSTKNDGAFIVVFSLWMGIVENSSNIRLLKTTQLVK